jgi:phage anti-repressor protein
MDGGLIETINARHLWEYLGVLTDFSDWIKRRIEEYGFIENVDYTILKFEVGKIQRLRGMSEYEYHITLDMTKELCMVERNDKGREARRYFIDREKRFNNIVQAFLGEPRFDARRYTVEFFGKVARVYGKRIPHDDKHSPMMRGFVDRYIYKPLPPEVRKTMDQRNPLFGEGKKKYRKYPLHQMLTEEMDSKFLKTRMDLVATFLDATGYGDKASFKRAINTYDKRHRMQLEIEGRTMLLSLSDPQQAPLFAWNMLQGASYALH